MFALTNTDAWQWAALVAVAVLAIIVMPRLR